MYTIQALWTAARYKIGVVWIIFNNRSYRILKQRVNAMRGFAAQTDRFVGMDLVEPEIDYLGPRPLARRRRRERRQRGGCGRSDEEGPRGRHAAADRRGARPRLQAGVTKVASPPIGRRGRGPSRSDGRVRWERSGSPTTSPDPRPLPRAERRDHAGTSFTPIWSSAARPIRPNGLPKVSPISKWL